MKRISIGLWAAAASVLLCACGGGSPEAPDSVEGTLPQSDATPAAEMVEALAVIEPRSGSGVSGTATFVYSGGEVVLTLEIEGAPPGEHAAHIHEFGDCSAEDGSSAGGHWNPTDEAHGRWDDVPFHLGDVGNVVVGDDGYGSLSLTTELWAIGTGESNDILGHSVIVHENLDDFTTQPTGAAGGRIGCGVIE